MISINGHTTRELSQAANLTPQRINQIAKQRGWTPVKVGRANVWTEADVTVWLDAHQRTQLLIKAGWWASTGPNGLCEDDAIDAECPKCGESAVSKPGDDSQIFCKTCGLSAA